MPVTAPDTAVANQIAAALTAESFQSTTWTVNGNIFVGPVVAFTGTGTPPEAIFWLANGGPPPGPVRGETVGGDLSRFTVQIWVRSDGDPGSFARCEALAMEVQSVLHKATIDGDLSCLAQQAQPIYMQTDSNGLYEFVLNVELALLQ